MEKLYVAEKQNKIGTIKEGKKNMLHEVWQKETRNIKIWGILYSSRGAYA